MPNPPPGRRPRLAWALLGLTVVLLASSVLIGSLRGQSWNEKFAFIPVSGSFAVVGALVAARTGNRLGWLFLAAATVSAVTVAAAAYAGPAPTGNLPGAAWTGWVFSVVLGARRAVVLADSAAVPRRPTSVAAVAARRCGWRPSAGSARRSVYGAVQRGILGPTSPTCGTR